MFRSQFSKKTPNPVRTGNFKKGATAAAPASKPATKAVKAAPKIVKKALSIARSHAGTVNSSNIRRVDFEVENDKPVVHIYFYDNLQGFPLDYVAASTTGDEAGDANVAPGFKGRTLIPLYNAANNSPTAEGKKNPHLDALQDMFDDMIIAGNLKTTDPNDTSFANGATPADGDNVHTYECVLHSDTRTFITDMFKAQGDGEGDNNEGGDDQNIERENLNINYHIISEQVNNSTNYYEDAAHTKTMRTQDAWMGFYRANDQGVSDVTKPTFLKLKIVRYEIDTLYAGYGKNVNGVMQKADEPTTKQVYALVQPEKIYTTPSDEGEGSETIGLTHFENFVCTECMPDPLDGMDIKGKINILCTEATTPEGVEATTYVNAIPGYEVLPKFDDQDNLVQLESRPISTTIPNEIEVSTIRLVDGNQQATNHYQTAEIAGGKKVIVALPEAGFDVAIEVCNSSYMEGEGANAVQKINQPELHLIDSTLVFGQVKGEFITKDKSSEISSRIKSITGALITGPIEVEDTLPDNNDNKAKGKLQYLKGVEFVNCTFKDGEVETDWFWMFDCSFKNCDMQMKAYADIKDHLQIIGEANRKSDKGDKGMSYRGGITSVDDLYAYVSSGNITVEGQIAENNPYILQYMDFNYTPKGEGSLPKIEYDEESNNTRVYGPLEQFKEEPPTCLYSPISLYYEVSTKPTNIPESVEDAYIELGSTKLVNTYYGLCGNVEADKLQKIYHKVNQVGISEDETYGYKYDMNPLNKATKDELMALITRWKYIASVIPINWRYLSELSDLFGKIVAFEENRMPCVREDGTGLDIVEDTNISKVTENETVVKGPITYHYTAIGEEDTQGNAIQYKWTENGTHAQMASKLATLHSMMYTNMQQGAAGEATPEDAANVATRLYTLTDLFLKTWEDYYKIGDNGQTISLTTELLDAGEFEIYEVEGIYETFIQSEADLLVAPKAENTDDNRYARTFMDIVISVDEIKKLINEAAKQEEEKEYVIDSVRLYKNPIYQTGNNEANANAILEYGQFLATIQSRRNLIQQGGEGGDEVLVKFTQTERGTFFEILGKEPESSSADVYEGAVAGFFISKGYQGKVAEGQKTQKPTIPKGRYDRKVRRSVIPAKPVSAAPEPRGENGEEWRITIVPKFYEGEPLDWTKDNYYTTFLFAQNADNLNIQIDPEFEARNKVVFTPGTGDNQPERLEEQMIGYFVAVPKKDPETDP